MSKKIVELPSSNEVLFDGIGQVIESTLLSLLEESYLAKLTQKRKIRTHYKGWEKNGGDFITKSDIISIKITTTREELNKNYHRISQGKDYSPEVEKERSTEHLFLLDAMGRRGDISAIPGMNATWENYF